ARLLAPGPVRRIGVGRLPDLRRWMQALAWRTAKLPDDPSADARRLAEVRHAEALMARGVPGWPVDDLMLADPQARAARQLIDEYRVRLFAQHLRTAVPVSEQRIAKFVASLDR
ncbi:MAG TPA: DUF3418 domain-containing protein, partial [Candidatus Nanopelagicales bacterium]